ncbi:MAG: DUF1559 domain-containing protein, partial [Planctomycetaceae bacterium]|nr:DUF1559 domain-containing protein [Planctomycetaceae bacterium]
DQSPLYSQIRLSEPWDSPHNAQFHETWPYPFRCPAQETKQKQVAYLAVIDTHTLWPGTACRSLRECVDGTSRTILVIEVAASGTHWMQPRDLELAEVSGVINGDMAKSISSQHVGGAHVVLADGAVRFLDTSTTESTIQSLRLIDDGQPNNF